MKVRSILAFSFRHKCGEGKKQRKLNDGRKQFFLVFYLNFRFISISTQTKVKFNLDREQTESFN